MRAQVSVILPVHNAEPWLDECLGSVLQQDFEGSMELSVFNDASKDKSMAILEEWKVKLEGAGILVVTGGHSSPSPRGVGYSKNQAIAQSSGTYLCFLDSDDVMMPQRVRLQLEAAARHPTSIIGCQVRREPPNSTERYMRWINQLTSDQLLTQVFTSNGPTVIMPTWFCSRAWFSHVGQFDEGGQGVPEDLLFFYNHLRKGGGVVRVDQSLLLYRYHPSAATHSILEYVGPQTWGGAGVLWTLRGQLRSRVQCPKVLEMPTCGFGETSALAPCTAQPLGEDIMRQQGLCLVSAMLPECVDMRGACPRVQVACRRSLVSCVSPKVAAFCDVDENKIRKGFYCYEDSQERPKPQVPILHFRAARPPFVICVKLDLTGGAFEDNLRSLHLQEGRDFLHFS
ncbi:PREDICTED: UDP-GlcNAc:betaGal beta-1,3-N-acetylglucosaminyltransferase-like protein 1 [Miniopterus natalensis]|uniref:UDP-GlcNAc:betaGal beta-1,3-N-acetylglucosaminyltransferase-like protein 1 n=1 Tax=Miniopterus natalensis TaxID=291302 RepID=UPI0007A71CC0|nr:PREDICTED: UDP-GlcNAc:betaGal beta-1,3-N-acetylglucosaminyltransferase-like protein 1 [Miniopterus natalensis]